VVKLLFKGDIDPLWNYYQFQTDSGDVELTLQEHSFFHLVASSDSGNIEKWVEDAQSNNTSGPQLKINTDSGKHYVQPQDD